MAKPDYGVDAPYVPLGFGAAGVLCFGIGVATGTTAFVGVAIFFLLQAGLFLHTTRRGKFVVWERLLDQLQLTGSEQLADLGCGRGATGSPCTPATSSTSRSRTASSTSW